MKTIRRVLPFLLLLLVACVGGGGSSQRVTTPQERADLVATLSTIETALGALHGTGKIPADHYQKAIAQVTDLRTAVASSETTPVSTADLLQRVLGIALAWGITLDK